MLKEVNVPGVHSCALQLFPDVPHEVQEGHRAALKLPGGRTNRTVHYSVSPAVRSSALVLVPGALCVLAGRLKLITNAKKAKKLISDTASPREGSRVTGERRRVNMRWWGLRRPVLLQQGWAF